MTREYRLAFAATFTMVSLFTSVSLGMLSGLTAMPLPPPPNIPPPALP